MKVKEFAYTAYAVVDVPKARAFYENVLGLKAGSVWESPEMAFIEYEIGPHTLAIGKGAPNFKPGTSGATVALEVDDFDASIKELESNNVVFIMKPQDVGPCNMALIKDPDGNQIMIHKRKEK
jgi:predicted enzyme related to lactoylglutathione lyase